MEEKGITDVPIPSVSTIRYQFNPGNLNRNTSSNYKCRFVLVCKIQRCQLGKFHEDPHYVNSYFLQVHFSYFVFFKSKVMKYVKANKLPLQHK